MLRSAWTEWLAMSSLVTNPFQNCSLRSATLRQSTPEASPENSAFEVHSLEASRMYCRKVAYFNQTAFRSVQEQNHPYIVAKGVINCYQGHVFAPS